MDKIKAFFQNKIVQIVSWVMIVVGATSLIIGGVTAEAISSGVALTAGIITAVGALIVFITKQLNK